MDVFISVLTNGKITQDKVGHHTDLLAGFPLRAGSVVLEVGCGESGNVANLRARPGRGGGGWCVALSEDALPSGRARGWWSRSSTAVSAGSARR
jgi:hypothetical protein